MKKTTKRIISILLSLLMLTAVFTLYISAKDIESTEDDIVEFQSACEKSKDDTTDDDWHKISNPNMVILRDFSCIEDIKNRYGVEKNYILYYCKACGKNIRRTFDNPAPHDMELIKRVSPTCIAEGTEQYYKCKNPNCGKITSDQYGNKPVELNDLKIEKAPHTYKDGKCTVCGVSQPNLCKYCGKDHGTSFSGRLTTFFHGILAAFGLKK